MNSPARAPALPVSGNTLLVVVMLIGILTLFLVSYLSMASSDNAAIIRSLRWNTALPLAEAGIEEALSHINKNNNNFAADGWVKSGTNSIYTKQRTLGTDYYAVSISGNPGSLLTLTSTGSVALQGTNYVSRTVRITVQTAQSFVPVGLIAKTSISFGGNLGVDSYDSSNPAYSTAGQYDLSKASDQATVATPGLGFSMGGSSHVLGYVAAGPGGSVTTGGNAKVGDKNWSSKGIEPGHSTNNFNPSIPDVTPLQSGNTPTSGKINGTNFTYIVNGGQYISPTLDAGGSSTTLYVASSSTLYVPGNINLNSVTFAPGATLQLIIGANSVSFCPQVLGGTPPQFVVSALPNCTSMDMTGGSSFVGVIYAPEAALKAAGHASICGAITADSFSCNGTFDFHYDLATKSSASSQSLTILTWAEP